ncbi:MAG: sulfatase-like hydrolase/transferase, partial [Bacteroidia bacterium]|nr:sulfatase-like hydrolase/transferase [Bacteroidia bacterium]
GYASHFNSPAIPPNVPNGDPHDFALNSLPDYYGMIEEIDTEFGRILSALETAGVADDTIVVFSSDHGDMIGSHGYKNKRWPHEESTRVPLLIRYPKAIIPNTVISDPIGTPDMYPTIAGLAGVASPVGLDGLDFSGLVTGKAYAPRDYVYMAMHYAYVPWPGWRAIRTGDYMYARVVDKPWLLFDMKNDPLQMINLIDDPSSKSLAEEMDIRLTSIIKETGDSWTIKATSGDISKWAPGGAKQKSAYLGVTWPGCGVTGIEDADTIASLNIFPNPTQGLFTIEMDNQMFGDLLINILTREGKNILRIKFEKTTVHFSSQIDLSGQPKGMYLINLLIDKYLANRKLIVE